MTEDLANCHRPITKLFERSTDAANRLSSEQLEFYEANGYLAGIKLLNQVTK